MEDERKQKHLELIQGVINRLAGNSFSLKGWSVVLISALLALLASDGNLMIAAVALIPVVTFWGLDGYFLWQERLYRRLYDHVRQQDDKDIDFSMDAAPDGPGWAGAVFSKTLLAFHGALMGVSILVILLVACIPLTGGE